MTDKEPLNVIDEQCWDELNGFADEAREIVQEYGDTVFGAEKLQQMITAVRNRSVVILRELADGASFPYRQNIRDTLKLLKPVQEES